MENRKIINASPRLLRATLKAVGVPELPSETEMQLVIRAEVKGSKLRDVAGYLLLVDRFYGRLDPKGLRSYAQRPIEQLELKETKAGSLELILAEGLGLLQQSDLIWLWVLLRGLPYAARAMTEAARNAAGVYHDIQAGRLAEAQRQELERAGQQQPDYDRHVVRAALRGFLDEDPRFAAMPAGDRAELARNLAERYFAEEDQVKGAREFSQSRILDISLRINGRRL